MKKRDFRRGVSVLMAAAMLFGTISSDGLTVRAEEQDAEWEDTELLVNGDFENETTGWTVSGGNADCKVDSNKWSTNTTNFYHVYAADDTEFSLEQKIEKVEPGTYKVVFEQDGAENMASGLQIGRELSLQRFLIRRAGTIGRPVNLRNIP